jgi:hypothetical protein
MDYKNMIHKMNIKSFYCFTSLGIYHISIKWMDVVSIMHGLFECVTQVEHVILQLFHLDEQVPH